MNRSQLFTDMWKMIIGQPALWIVALIGSGVSTIISLVLSSLSFGTGVSIVIGLLDTAVSLVTAAFVTGAVVRMVNTIAEGQKVSVNDGFQAGLQKIVPLVFVQLALMLPIWIAILLFTGSFVAVFTSALGQPNGLSPTSMLPLLTGGGLIGLVLVAFVIAIITSLISVGADRSVVLEDLAVFAALRRGWQLAREHFSDFVGIGVYMIIVGLGIAIAFACTIGALISSAVVGQMTASGNLTPASNFSAPVLLSTLVNLALSSFVGTLFSGVWTLAFRKWQGK